MHKRGFFVPMLSHQQEIIDGNKAIPLFRWLTSQKGFEDAISWNFNKFLIDRNGKLIQRFGTRTKPEELTTDIEKVLNSK